MSNATDTISRPVGQATGQFNRQFHRLSPSEQRADILRCSTGIYYFFDKLRFRDSVRPSDDVIAVIKANAKSVNVKPDKLRFDYEIIVTVPNAALSVIAAQAPYWRLVEAEPAREVCFADWFDPVALHHSEDALLVHHARRQLRIVTHRKGETITAEQAEAHRLAGRHTSYSGGRDSDFLLAWYGGRPSKITGEPCFKFEGRIRGAEQLDHFGLSTATLCDFDIAAFIADHERLAIPDPVKVALAFLRDHPQPLPPATRHYPDPLFRLGCFIIRSLSYYPGATHCFRASQCYATEVHSTAHLTPI